MRNILRTVLLVCMFLFAAISVNAEMISDTSISGRTVTVEIQGAEPNEMVSLTVLMFDKTWDGEKLTNGELHFQPGFFEDGDSILYFHAVSADSFGNAKFEFALKNEDLSAPEYGVYPMQISGKNGIFRQMLSYSSENAFSELYAEIQNAESAEDLRQFFDSPLQMTILGIDRTEYLTLNDEARNVFAEEMMKSRKKEFEEFQADFNAAIKSTAFIFSTDEEVLGNMISEAAKNGNAEIYGLGGVYKEYDKEKAWVDTLQTLKHYADFLQEIAALKYDKQDGAEGYFKNVRTGAALTLIRDTGYGYVPLILESFEDVLEIDPDDVPAGVDKGNVYKALSGQQYKNAAALKQAWEQAVKQGSADNNGSGRPSGSGGSGGGSGGSGGGAAITLPRAENVSEGQTAESDTGSADREEDFADVAPEHWAADIISKLKEQKIVQGDGDHFYPDAPISRAEFAKLLVTFGFTGEPSEEKSAAFTDVEADAWYAPYIEEAFRTGCIRGYEDGSFRPQEYITREDIAVILARALSVEVLGDGISFADRAEISDYAKDAVYALSGKGIIKGSDGLFMPKANATRAEACAMLCRAANWGK